MTTLIITAAVIALVFAMILSLIAIVGVSVWRVIYYVIGCRKAPIQKTLLTSAIVLWVVAGGIIALLP